MIWRLLVLLGVSVVLLMGVECRIREGKTLTFRRTQHSDSQGRMCRRPRRDASSSPGTSKPSHGPPFTPCRLLLTPAEHEVLGDNTHEVSCTSDIRHCSDAGKSLVNIGRCNVRRAFYLMWRNRFQDFECGTSFYLCFAMLNRVSQTSESNTNTYNEHYNYVSPYTHLTKSIIGKITGNCEKRSNLAC